MKFYCLRFTLTSLSLVVSTTLKAAGFVALSPSGYPVPGGVSAYTLCNPTGNFGLGESVPPTPAANNTCAIFPPFPFSGYTQVGNVVRLVTHNSITIASVNDRVLRNGNICIYGTKVHMFPVQYSPGRTFEVNDVVRSGFRNRGPVSFAYYYDSSTSEVLFRAGLTFTSVTSPPAPPQPLISVGPISTNYVVFTTDINSNDPDGSTKPDSSWLYIKSSCTSATPTALNGAIQLRQTGQSGQPVIYKRIPGYAPAGANATP